MKRNFSDAEARHIMQIEKECVRRAGACDRDCLNCELMQDSKMLLACYDLAISALEDRLSRAKGYQFCSGFNYAEMVTTLRQLNKVNRQYILSAAAEAIERLQTLYAEEHDKVCALQSKISELSAIEAERDELLSMVISIREENERRKWNWVDSILNSKEVKE